MSREHTPVLSGKEERALSQLLKKLTDLGFGGPRVEAELRTRIANKTKDFGLLHRKDYGNNIMHYALHVSTDDPAEFFLRGVSVVLRNKTVPDIPQGFINGINLTQLEKNMREVDWSEHYEDKVSELVYTIKNADDARRADIFKKLSVLEQYEKGRGANDFSYSVAERLKFKYLPAFPVEKFAFTQDPVLQKLHDQTIHFLEGSADQIRMRWENGSKNADRLLKSLIDLGFPEKLSDELEHEVHVGKNKLLLHQNDRTDNDQVRYTLWIEKDGPNSYRLESYDIDLRVYPEIPDITINGFNAIELDDLMKQFDWSYIHGKSDKTHKSDDAYLNQEQAAELRKINKGINQFLKHGQWGKQIAERLVFKYWMDGPNKPNHMNLDSLKTQYDFSHKVHVIEGATFPLAQSLNYLRQIASNSLQLNNNQLPATFQEHYLSDEVLGAVVTAISKGEHWMAYNGSLDFARKEDVYFFATSEDANSFAKDNISEADHFQVRHISSAQDLLQQMDAPPESLRQVLPNKQIITTKYNCMNQKNVDYLVDQVKYAGFGDALENQLKEKIQQQQPSFQLEHKTSYGKDEVVANLHFKRSEKNDEMYFFNKFDLAVKHPGSEEMVKQTFYLNNKGSNITLKEGYNLMEGRAVYKQGLEHTNKEKEVTKYNAWIQLNPNDADKNGNLKKNEYRDQYKFDIDKVLSSKKFTEHIKELRNDTERAFIADSLKKGNKHYVTVINSENNAETKHWIEANPRKWTLNIYDTDMKPVILQTQKEKNGQEQSAKQDMKQGKKASNDEEGGTKATNKQRQKSGQKVG